MAENLPLKIKKQHLPARLEVDLIERLITTSAALKASIPDTIALALDALDREKNLPKMLAERVGNIEEILSALVNLITEFSDGFSDKMQEASVNEKERLKSLLQLIERKIQEHDQAEEARFQRIKPPTF